MNGTSCATLSSASWLSIVIADGVRDDVGVRIALDRAQHRGEVHAGGRDAADAEGRAGAAAAGARLAGLSIGCASVQRDSTPPTGCDESRRAECRCRRCRRHTAQFTPSSAFLSTLTSTMMASTSTCMRRISSLSMIVMSERMTLGGRRDDQRVGLRAPPRSWCVRSALAATLLPRHRRRPARRR